MSDEETNAGNYPSTIQEPPSFRETAIAPQPEKLASQDVEHQAIPPSYESIFGRLKSAKKDSSSDAVFMKVAVNICCGSAVAIVCVAVVLAFMVAEIGVGAAYLHDCPAQRLIPIYLVVAGVFGTVKGLGLIMHSAIHPIDWALNVFLFAWFICGNVWVYGLKGEWVSSPSTAGNFCDPTLYHFAFWMVTLTYILLGVMLSAGCIIIIVACCVQLEH